MVLRSFGAAGAALLAMAVGAGDAAAWCVRGVAGWDTLRIRTGPSPDAREIGRIPPAACGVAIVGPCRGSWCPVQWRNRVGWSNASYLARGGLFDFLATPQITRPPPRLALPPPPRPQVRAPEAGRKATAARQPARPAQAATAPRTRTTARAAPPTRTAAAPPRPPQTAPLPAAPMPAPSPPAAAQSPPPTPPPAPAAAPAVPAIVPPATAAPAQKAPADAAREVCVVDVPKGDTLKVRAGPGSDQNLRYGYPAGVCGVRITGPCSNGWCPVDYRGYRGWAEQKHLR